MGNKWITFLVFLFIIYSVAKDRIDSYQPEPAKKSHNAEIPSNNSGSSKPQAVTKLPPEMLKVESADKGSLMGNFIAKTINNALQTEQGQQVFNKIITQVPQATLLPTLPEYLQQIKTVNITSGKGVPIECGQKIKLTYSASALNGTLISKSEVPLELSLGMGSFNKKLETLLIGMKIGQKREFTLPKQVTENDNKFFKNIINPDGNAKVTVTLDDAEQIVKDNSYIQVFEQNKGTGVMSVCGDLIKIKYRVLRVDGKFLNDSETPKSIIVGSKDTPYGLNFACQYLAEGGVKTIIMPPRYTKNIFSQSLTGFLPADIKLPENEITIWQIERM